MHIWSGAPPRLSQASKQLRTRRGILVILVVAIFAVGAVFSAVYLVNQSKGLSLPPGCSKPQGGFLIVASIKGFNDSIDHGVPLQSWPIIDVQKGSTVNITVCNNDTQAHGFQISNYYDAKVVSLGPGEIIHVSFVASKTGSFQIYCVVFCTVHYWMQSGKLVVS